MINFSQNATINLHKIDNAQLNRNAQMLLVEGEQVIGVYKTVRDQVIFTNKRLITVDVQGITGKRQELVTLPYSTIQYFSVQTVGFAELIPDAELSLYFTNGLQANFEFRGSCDILEIGRMISRYTLAK
ncbi:MAG: PH domain-containing protein [Clostridia bacterium]|nr:PH domain-containing protein [Clostridia bacterium]